MIQSCSKKVLLIRHAESEYNLAVKKLDRDALNYVEAKRKVMLDNTLIDCGITEEGVKQCKDVSQKLTELNIDVVLVSPLRRAIQTAHHLFYRHPRQPKLVVHPIVREMIGFSCDVGGQLIQTMNEYPHFDYSLILNSEFSQQYPNLWSVEHIWNKYLILFKLDNILKILYKQLRINFNHNNLIHMDHYYLLNILVNRIKQKVLKILWKEQKKQDQYYANMKMLHVLLILEYCKQ